MAFQFAYSLDGNLASIVKDFPLDTVANYGNGGTKRGDLVLQVGGLIKRAGAAAGTAFGVLEGGEFVGLVAQGQPYASVNSSFTASAIDTNRNPNGVGKVRIDKSAVYRVPVAQAGAKQAALTADIGSTFAIILQSTDQQVDLNTTTTPSVKIVDISKDGKTVFVTLI